MFEDDDLSHFTTPMLFMNWAAFVGAGTLAGWYNIIVPFVIGLPIVVWGRIARSRAVAPAH